MTKIKKFSTFEQNTPIDENAGGGELVEQKSTNFVDEKAHMEIQKIWKTLGELSTETKNLAKYIKQNK